MPRAANAFGKRQLVVRAPGKKPSFHVLVPGVVPGLHLPVCLAQLRQHLFLYIIDRRCVRHEHILTPGSGFTENTKFGSRGKVLFGRPKTDLCMPWAGVLPESCREFWPVREFLSTRN
jgi:hypothetical protein